MVVSGAVGLMKQFGGEWAKPVVLRNMKVVLDVTDGLFWLVRRPFLSGGRRIDLMGSDFVALCAFYRDFIERLLEHQVRLIVVYDGGRIDESRGDIASKRRQLGQSYYGQIRALSNRHLALQMRRAALPKLANNAVKEVLGEFLDELEDVQQCTYEVYPLLSHLADLHQCPVMTSLGDFIFTHLPESKFGHIWLEDLDIPSARSKPMTCQAYSHLAMLKAFNIPSDCGPAMRGLYCILRDDFGSAHHEPVNRLLELPEEVEFRARPARVRTDRLVFVLEHWPRHLTSVEAIRLELLRLASSQRKRQKLASDFDAVMETFEEATNFGTASNHRHLLEDVDLNEAMTRREATADFIMSLRNTDFHRPLLEDFDTFRSTYSLQDRVKQYLLNRMGLKRLRLFDRNFAEMRRRELPALRQPVGPLTRSLLFDLFHFDEEMLAEVSNKLQVSLRVPPKDCHHLALLLLLARFGLKLGFRNTYDNEDRRPSAAQGSRSGGSTDVYQSRALRERFLIALVNSFVYHQIYGAQIEASRSEVPADIRVAGRRLDELVEEEVPTFEESSDELTYEQYIKPKHLVEMLNSTLRAYKELNSLYNFVGPNILVGRYYNGVLIYKIMRQFSENMRSSLLKLDEEEDEDRDEKGESLFDMLNS